MYYTHPGYETSIFGKNCAHYIQIFTVITEIQNGCHLATFCRINPKIELVLPITVVHNPTRFYENHLETSCIILFRHWQLHDLVSGSNNDDDDDDRKCNTYIDTNRITVGNVINA